MIKKFKIQNSKFKIQNSKFKFTDQRIRALPANDPNSASTELEVSDTEVIGLKCLCGKSGSKRWLLRYTFESRKRAIAIGRYPDVDLVTARKVARKHKNQIAEGIDPKAAKEERKSLPTVSEFFWDHYLPHIKCNKKSWDQDIQRFSHYVEPTLGSIRYRDLRAMDEQNLQNMLINSYNNRKRLSPSTCNRALAILKTMGGYAYRLDIIPSNEAMKIRLLKEDNIRMRFFDQDETRRIIAAARQYRRKSSGAFICMLLLSGCRTSEMRNAKHEHLDREGRTLFIPMTKSGHPRTVYLSDLALEIIDAIDRVAGNPYIFPGIKPGRPLSSPRVAFDRILEQAGITDLEGVCFHTCRHTAASNLVSAGFSLMDVKYQFAHRSIQSSERYANLGQNLASPLQININQNIHASLPVLPVPLKLCLHNHYNL